MRKSLLFLFLTLSLRATDLVVGTSFNSVKNDTTGWVGMQWTPNNNLTVLALGGQLYSGTGTHHTKIVDASDGTDVAGTNVTYVNAPGITTFTNLGTPVTLTSGHSYYVVTDVTSGGDFFFDLFTLTVTSDASEDNAIFGTGPGDWHTYGGPNSAFGFPNVRYIPAGAGIDAPTITLSSPSAGLVSGIRSFQAVPVPGTLHTVYNVIFYIDGIEVFRDKTSPYIYQWDTTTATNAVHVLTASVTDEVSQTTTSAATTVTVLNATVPANFPVDVDSTSTQIIVHFRAPDIHQCRISVYSDPEMFHKVNDTDENQFSGSENCTRVGNMNVGNMVNLVIGSPGSQVSDYNNVMVSRTLRVAKTYYIKAWSTVDGTFGLASISTKNIPFGDTKDKHVPVVNGKYAFPDFDFSDEGQQKGYVDPFGIEFHRIRNKHSGLSIATGYAFANVFDEATAWSNPNRALNTTAPFAIYSGTARAALFLPFPVEGLSTYTIGPSTGIWWGGITVDNIRLRLYGSAPGATGNDRNVLACLGVRHVSGGACVGPWVRFTLPDANGTVTGPSSFPSYFFKGWGLETPFPNAEDLSVPFGNHISVTSSVATITDPGLPNGNFFLPVNLQVGEPIKIGSSWYNVGTLIDASHFTLSQAGINITDTTWQTGGFGIILKKETATGNTINVGTSFDVALGRTTLPPVNGDFDLCSHLSIDIPYDENGVAYSAPPYPKGRLCQTGGLGSSNGFMFWLLDNGKTRFLGPMGHDDSGVGFGPETPFGSFSTTDPLSLFSLHSDNSYGNVFAGGGAEAAAGRKVFYKVTYKSSVCHFRDQTGDLYNTSSSDESSCWDWVNQNPRNPANGGTIGATITEQMTTAVGTVDSTTHRNATYPFWNDPTLTIDQFHLRQICNGVANFQMSVLTQNNPSIHLAVRMSDFQVDRVYDTISCRIPSICFASTHSTGYQACAGQYVLDDIKQADGSEGDGYGVGPFVFPPTIAVKFAAGDAWDTNTQINPGTLSDVTRAAGPCPANPYVATGSVECMWMKLSTDRPCNMFGTANEAMTFPCPWHPTGTFANTADLVAIPGMYIMRGSYTDNNVYHGGPGGKTEEFRILTKSFDGVNFVYVVQRWAVNDNKTCDYTQGAVAQFEHCGYPGNATHMNGWTAMMGPTPYRWVQMLTPLSSTNAYVDSVSGAYGHIGHGVSTSGTDIKSVGGGVSKDGIATLGVDRNYNIMDSTFNGVTINPNSSNIIEQYPNLSQWIAATLQSRSMYLDLRAINPDVGTGNEHIGNPWTHTCTLVSGQSYTYECDIFRPLGDHKSRRPYAFTPRIAFKDISGPGVIISDSTLNSSCYAYKTGWCRSGGAANKMYVSAKNLFIAWGACAASTYRVNSPCITPMWHYAGWVTQGETSKDDPSNLRTRRITTCMTAPGGQYQFAATHLTPDGKQFMCQIGWLNNIRYDTLVAQMPPMAPFDSIDRSKYIPLTIQMGPGLPFARVRFGYAQNGSPFHCTEVNDDCVTDQSLAPFAYVTADTLTPTSCASGCTIIVPTLSDSALNYRVERSQNGTTNWIYDYPQVRSTP